MNRSHLGTEEDRILFHTEPETTAPGALHPDRFWNIMIVDDDHSVHDVSRLILKDFHFQGQRTHLIHAYSAKQAIALAGRR